jgi:hypothetical protein
MMLLHQLPVTRLIAGTNGPDYDLTQVQELISPPSTPPNFQVLPRGTIQRRGGIVQNKLQPLKTYTTWAPGRIHPGASLTDTHAKAHDRVPMNSGYALDGTDAGAFRQRSDHRNLLVFVEDVCHGLPSLSGNKCNT